MDFITETQYRQEISDLWARINQHKPQLAALQDQLTAAQAALLREGITVGELQAQLAERDKEIVNLQTSGGLLSTEIRDLRKTILSNQARIEELVMEVEWLHPNSPLVFIDESDENSKLALEVALKSERIKTLEDAAGECFAREQAIECYHRLHEMANELKE